MKSAFDIMAAKEKKMRFLNNLPTMLVAVMFSMSLGVNAFGNILKFVYFHKSNITPNLLMLDAFVIAFALLMYRALK